MSLTIVSACSTLPLPLPERGALPFPVLCPWVESSHHLFPEGLTLAFILFLHCPPLPRLQATVLPKLLGQEGCRLCLKRRRLRRGEERKVINDKVGGQRNRRPRLSRTSKPGYRLKGNKKQDLGQPPPPKRTRSSLGLSQRP
jgi:hypothetical protein